MKAGILVGEHTIIASDDFFGVKVIATRFGLHLVGKNEIVLASSLNKLSYDQPMSVLQNRASDLIVAFVNRDYKHFDQVYHVQHIKKGA